MSESVEHESAVMDRPEPTASLRRKFPPCSIIRPTNTEGAANGARMFLTRTGLFRGQSAAFHATLKLRGRRRSTTALTSRTPGRAPHPRGRLPG